MKWIAVCAFVLAAVVGCVTRSDRFGATFDAEITVAKARHARTLEAIDAEVRAAIVPLDRDLVSFSASVTKPAEACLAHRATRKLTPQQLKKTSTRKLKEIRTAMVAEREAIDRCLDSVGEQWQRMIVDSYWASDGDAVNHAARAAEPTKEAPPWIAYMDQLVTERIYWWAHVERIGRANHNERLPILAERAREKLNQAHDEELALLRAKRERAVLQASGEDALMLQNASLQLQQMNTQNKLNDLQRQQRVQRCQHQNNTNPRGAQLPCF